MTVRQSAAARPDDSVTRQVSPESDEARQREHELSEALTAARHLQARLEMIAGRERDVAVVRSLRDSLARDLGELAR